MRGVARVSSVYVGSVGLTWALRGRWCQAGVCVYVHACACCVVYGRVRERAGSRPGPSGESSSHRALYSNQVQFYDFFFVLFYKKLKNVSCEYDRVNG